MPVGHSDHDFFVVEGAAEFVDLFQGVIGCLTIIQHEASCAGLAIMHEELQPFE